MSTPGKRNSSGTRDSDRSAQVCLEKPKLELNRSVDKTEEEEKVKLLLRDDFIDDGEPINFDNGPVILPMIKGKLYKEDTKVAIEKEEEEEIDRKPINFGKWRGITTKERM